MGRTEYRAAASAYRARLHKVHAIGMTFASRPMNADDAAERRSMNAAMADLPPAPKPRGFDIALGPDPMLNRAWVRQQLLAQARADRSELKRRAWERGYNEALGIAGVPSYIVTDETLREGPKARLACYLRAVRGNPWPLACLKAQEAVIRDFIVIPRQRWPLERAA